MSKKVQIVEVGARDGLQNEEKTIPWNKKTRLIKELSRSGLQRIEAGAFVSPKWVPQMADSLKVAKHILKDQASGKLPRTVRYSCLVPNEKGMELALQSGIKEIAIFGASSESFSKRNINCSIAESFERFKNIVKLAKKNRIKVRGYLSTAFGCPYEGQVSQAKVARLVKRMFDLGVYEVSVGDTIGVATPKQVESVISKIEKQVGLKNIAMHFHDTRGTALANVHQSLQMGVRVFDSSVGGLGGCPYAKGAAGNLATEDLVYMLHGLGFKTDVNLDKLMSIRHWLQKELSRELPAKVSRAGHPW